jgi:hypothetical protein
MSSVRSEIAEFQHNKHERAAHARQMAALQIVCGVDLAAALSSAPPERDRIISRLTRKLRRERQRGLARHWAYSLDRHIALKQALDRLITLCPEKDEGGRGAAFGSHAANG